MLCYSTPKKLLSLQRGDGLYYCKHAVSVYEVLFGVPYGTNKHCLGRSPQSLLPLRRNALKIREEGQSLSTANTHTHTHTLLGGCFYFYFLCLCGKKTCLPRDETFTEVLEVRIRIWLVGMLKKFVP